MKILALVLALTACGPTTADAGSFEADAGVGGTQQTHDASTNVQDSAFPSSGGSVSSSGGTGGSVDAGAESGGTTATSCAHPPPSDPIVDDADLEPGPIVKFTAHLYYVKRAPDDQIVNPPETTAGHFEVKVGDKIVYDSTQKNSSNQICQWENLPEWSVSDSCAFSRLKTTNPFLLQMQADAPGVLEAFATIDGVTSNTIVVNAVP